MLKIIGQKFYRANQLYESIDLTPVTKLFGGIVQQRILISQINPNHQAFVNSNNSNCFFLTQNLVLFSLIEEAKLVKVCRS